MDGIDDPMKRGVYTVQQLEKAIRKKSRYEDVFHSEEERLSAEKQWNSLKLHIGWQASHYRDLSVLNIEEAGPEVSCRQLQQAIDKAVFSPEDEHLKQMCVKFLEMLQKID